MFSLQRDARSSLKESTCLRDQSRPAYVCQFQERRREVNKDEIKYLTLHVYIHIIYIPQIAVTLTYRHLRGRKYRKIYSKKIHENN